MEKLKRQKTKRRRREGIMEKERKKHIKDREIQNRQ